MKLENCFAYTWIFPHIYSFNQNSFLLYSDLMDVLDSFGYDLVTQKEVMSAINQPVLREEQETTQLTFKSNIYSCKSICCYTHSEQRNPSGRIRSWRPSTLRWHDHINPIMMSPGAWAPQVHLAESLPSLRAVMLLSVIRTKRRLRGTQYACIFNAVVWNSSSGMRGDILYSVKRNLGGAR